MPAQPRPGLRVGLQQLRRQLRWGAAGHSGKIFIATKNILSGGGSYAGSESSYPGLGQQQPPLQPQQPLYSASVSPGQLSRSAR